MQRYVETNKSDGEIVIADSSMADGPGISVKTYAVDISGNGINITPPNVRLYASDFTNGNVWYLIADGMFSPTAMRVKAVKSGISASVDKLVFVIERGADSQSQYPMSTGRAVVSQSLVDWRIKQGQLFTASRRVTQLAAGANLDSAIVTGSVPAILFQRTVGYTGKGVAASVYRAATYTGGTVQDVQNPNDINPGTPTLQLIAGGTASNLVNLTVATAYSEGNASNQGQGNAEAKLGEPVIMLPNTTYVLRITSLDTSDQNINAYISWYEGWDDIVA
ncbi:hypothetical protein [Enterobacter kobei]